MSTEVKMALRKDAFACLNLYKKANQAKQRALVRGDIEDLIAFTDDEAIAWDAVAMAVKEMQDEPWDQNEA